MHQASFTYGWKLQDPFLSEFVKGWQKRKNRTFLQILFSALPRVSISFSLQQISFSNSIVIQRSRGCSPCSSLISGPLNCTAWWEFGNQLPIINGIRLLAVVMSRVRSHMHTYILTSFSNMLGGLMTHPAVLRTRCGALLPPFMLLMYSVV